MVCIKKAVYVRAAASSVTGMKWSYVAVRSAAAHGSKGEASYGAPDSTLHSSFGSTAAGGFMQDLDKCRIGINAGSG